MLDVTRLVRMDKGAKEVVIGMLRLYKDLKGIKLISTINVQNYFQLISSYKIPVKKEKTLT